MGALIMAHGDDNGLVLPPALAPIQVVMVPIYKSDEERNLVLDKMYEVKKALEAKGHSVEVDDRDNLRPGFKFAEWELKGVPVRLAMGPRDLQNGTVEVARRDTLEKITEPLEGLDERIIGLLDDIQKSIYDGTAETEARIQEETKATIRCIPVDSFVVEEEGKCVYSGKPSHQRVIFARSY